MIKLMLTGAALTVTGMILVFLFLSLLVATIHLMSWLLARYAQSSQPSPAVPQGGHAGEDAGEIIAAITAALKRYLSDLQK